MVIFELYDYRPYWPDPRGPRLANPWTASLTTYEDQKAHWETGQRSLHVPPGIRSGRVEPRLRFGRHVPIRGRRAFFRGSFSRAAKSKRSEPTTATHPITDHARRDRSVHPEARARFAEAHRTELRGQFWSGQAGSHQPRPGDSMSWAESPITRARWLRDHPRPRGRRGVANPRRPVYPGLFLQSLRRESAVHFSDSSRFPG